MALQIRQRQTRTWLPDPGFGQRATMTLGYPPEAGRVWVFPGN
jgi:hypothetical protein